MKMLALRWSFWMALGLAAFAEPAFQPRDYAQKVDRQIEAMEKGPEEAQYGPYWCSEVVVNLHDHPWPAVGIYKMRYRFYFDRDEGDDKRDPRPYPDRLVKVVGRRTSSARWEQRQVWFHQGKPVYFERSTPEGQTQIDLLGPPSRLQQEAQRDAGEMLRFFRSFELLP